MSIKVLLVDDEKMFIEYLAKRLRVRGFDLTLVYDGDEAIAVANEQDFHVVVLDVLMPGRNGIEILKELKGLHPSVQVIIVTGHGTEHLAHEAKRYGASDFLLKPCDLETMIEAIKKAYKCFMSNSEN